MDAGDKHSAFLKGLLDKTLHISVIDGRLFSGSFRCTDNESNIVLSNAFEYRNGPKSKQSEANATKTSRFLGLIVVPKHQIRKIELEERRNEQLGLPLRAKD